jgi:hypothetical protein
VTVGIHVAITIGARPASVWDSIEDVARHVDWMADAVSITFRSPQRTGIGTEFECLTRVGPLRTTDVMRITEWAPRSSMGIEHRGIVTGSGRFTLAPSGTAATLFAWDERLSFPWWMGGFIGERAAKPILTRIWRNNLRRLRSQVEAR